MKRLPSAPNSAHKTPKSNSQKVKTCYKTCAGEVVIKPDTGIDVKRHQQKKVVGRSLFFFPSYNVVVYPEICPGDSVERIQNPRAKYMVVYT